MSKSPNLSSSQFFNNTAGGLQLDLVQPGDVDVYQDRGAFTMYKLNRQYGHQENSLSASSGSLIYNYMKCMGACFKGLASLLPGVCCRSYAIEIPQGFIGMVTENGKFVRKLRPGFHMVNALIEKVLTFDIRDCSMHLPHQQVLSRDGVSFGIDAVINYKIIVPELVLYTMTNCMSLVKNVAEAALKCVIGQTTFGQMMKDRTKLNKKVQEYIEIKLEGTGLQVNLVETQSIELSHHLYNVMAMVVEAENRAKALVIEAQGDLEGARLLAQAAENLSGNPNAIVLQGWELFENLSHFGLNTIIVPHDILSSFREPQPSETSGPQLLQAVKSANALAETDEMQPVTSPSQKDVEMSGEKGLEVIHQDQIQTSLTHLKTGNPFEDDEEL